MNILKASSLMYNSILEIEIALADYQSMIESLTTGITFSHSGNVLASLLPPRVLIQSLKELQKDDMYNMPTFEISVDNYRLIIKISETFVYLDDSKIITVLKTPIADHEIYSVVRFLPVPQKVSKKYYRMINLPDRRMFISKNRSKYFLTNNEPLQCFESFNYNYSKLKSNIIQVRNQSICEVSLINNKVDKCDQHYFEILNNFYITLETGYQWFVAPSEMTVFHVSCFKNKFQTMNFDITSNSILSVRSDCIVANRLTMLTPERNANFTIVEHLNFSKNIEIEDIPDNFLPTIHINPIDTKNLFKQGMKLDELNKKLIELNKLRYQQSNWQAGLDYLNTFVYICFLGLVLYLLITCSSVSCCQQFFKICCCLWLKPKKKTNHKLTPNY